MKFDQKLLNNLRTGVLLIDQDLLVIYANSSAEVIIGRSGVAGAQLHDILQSSELLEQINSAQKENRSISLREIETLNKSIKPLTLNVDISLVENNILLELEQVDQQIKLFQQQVRQQKQNTSTSLLRGLAHEIKNPLGGIRGAAQLLGSEFNNAEVNEYTDIIIAESDRLKDLIDRILRPQQQPRFQRLNIHEITEHIYALVNANKEKQVTITRDYDTSIPEVMVDKDQLIQVVLNLINNAYEAVDNNGNITITTRISRNQYIVDRTHPVAVSVSIADDGPGIGDELYPKIFFPMISGRADGSGLGLSIAHKLIALNRGELKCTSHYNGCIFEIILPLSKRKPQQI